MNEFWAAFVQNLMLTFAPVLASLVAAWLIAKTKEALAKAKDAEPDLVDTLSWIAKQAVRAAEQAGGKQVLGDKKEYALTVAEQYLQAKGMNIDLTLISAAIEAAVWTEFNDGRDKDKPKAAAGFDLTAATTPTTPLPFLPDEISPR